MQLAPDAASLKAGQGLAHAKKWGQTGRDDAFVWGECQGSGAKPYQVRFDLTQASSKCSCPSRKFPCKHVLGLMLIFSSSPDAIASRPMPAWVEEWVAGLAERAKKKQEKAEALPKPVDEEAQADRLEKRLSRIAQGLAALKIWTEDLVRGGIAAVPTRGYAFFDEPARRLIDAQAPGVAARVKRLAQVAASGAGWQHRFVEQLASLHLLIRAFEGMAALPASVREDVLATVGIPLRPEEIAQLPSTHDTWQVIALEVEVEERLRVQRTWLFGIESRRPALVLAFAHGTAPLETSLLPAMSFEGDLSFFPGDEVRAAVKGRGDLKPLTGLSGLGTFDELTDFAGAHFARHPWLDEVSAPIHQVTPVKSQDAWMMVDSAGRSLPASLGDEAGWLSLAVSGGHAVDLVAGYDGRRLRPLAIMAQGEYVPLHNAGLR